MSNDLNKYRYELHNKTNLITTLENMLRHVKNESVNVLSANIQCPTVPKLTINEIFGDIRATPGETFVELRFTYDMKPKPDCRPPAGPIRSGDIKRGKPPIGIKPRFIFLEQRVKDLRDAIIRYIKTDERVPHEWMMELDKINQELSEMKK